MNEERQPNEGDKAKVRRHVVVCVDDEARILAAIRRILRREPYELLTTSDPREALEWIEKRDVSVLVVDERMPQMRGVDVLKVARERSPGTARVMLTAYPHSGMILERVSKGIQRLITKPWRDEDLRRMIQDLVREREAVESARPEAS
ncbi:MAG: response regulator [Planctomycetes bacterium]|nr:response regulator [Planctomycetota bacterium]